MVPALRTENGLSTMELPPPLRPLRYGAQQKPWLIMDGTSTRPGFRLTPQKLVTAFLEAEMGVPMLQCDAFEDIIENDGHLRGQYESRLTAIALRPWLIRPGGKDAIDIEAAAVLTYALKKCNMHALLWHLMEALGFGYSGANACWKFDEKTNAVIPFWFLLAWQRRFLVSNAGMGNLTFRTEMNQWPGEPLNYGEWVVSRRFHRLVVRSGLMRTAAWWALFKRLSVTDWIVFAEKFGIPVVLGTYNERASPESRAALEAAITDIGSDGQAILSELTSIQIQSVTTRSGDVSALHPAVIARCDSEISKVITGATLNVESGGPGSFALGKVHEGRANQLVFGDAIWLQDVFARHVIEPFMLYNPRYANAKPPELFISVRPDMAPPDAVKVYGKLQAMGLEIEDEQMYAEFGLRRPEVGGVLEPLYEAIPPTPPNPTAET